MPSKPPNARGKQNLLARTAINRVVDQRRGSASERGYDARWSRAAKAHLNEHPFCRYCATSAKPRVTPATLVDHFWPHKGDLELFWDPRWWVSSCAPCHNGFKQRLEHAGKEAMDRVAKRLGLEPRDP
jgi:5-methylcytosine-specific restriction protein A